MNNIIRSIPAVGTILGCEDVRVLIEKYGRELVTSFVKRTVTLLRRSVVNGGEVISTVDIVATVEKELGELSCPSLRPLINATGIILHTNLGRAPLGDLVSDAVASVIRGYSNLEYDCSSAKRGHRSTHLEKMLNYITGAEASLVVNNNAAAILLVLNTLSKRKEVIISRSELVEIGGAFRIPDIMRAGNVKMVEVGTTNRTRISDYYENITERTKMLFKAHQSNFSMTGFVEDVSVKQMADCAQEHDLLMVYDLGSGLLKKPSRLKNINEPDVKGSIAAGADLVTFSCDKLLGGPQAGIIVGRADLIKKLSKAPLMRALRVGKMTYAGLDAVCRAYLDETKLFSAIPVLSTLNQSVEIVENRAKTFSELLTKLGIANTIKKSDGQCGGGTLPDFVIESRSVRLELNKKKAERLFMALHAQKMPVIAIRKEGGIFFDLLTVSDNDIVIITNMIYTCLQNL